MEEKESRLTSGGLRVLFVVGAACCKGRSPGDCERVNLLWKGRRVSVIDTNVCVNSLGADTNIGRNKL